MVDIINIIIPEVTVKMGEFTICKNTDINVYISPYMLFCFNDNIILIYFLSLVCIEI